MLLYYFIDIGWLEVIFTWTSMIEERFVLISVSILSLSLIFGGGTYFSVGFAIFMMELEDLWFLWYPDIR